LQCSCPDPVEFVMYPAMVFSKLVQVFFKGAARKSCVSKPADSFYSIHGQMWVCKLIKLKNFIELLSLPVVGCGDTLAGANTALTSLVIVNTSKIWRL